MIIFKYHRKYRNIFIHQQVQLHANNMHIMHLSEMHSVLFPRKYDYTGLINYAKSHITLKLSRSKSLSPYKIPNIYLIGKK